MDNDINCFSVLYIGSEGDFLIDILREKFSTFEFVPLETSIQADYYNSHEKKFNYLISMKVLEQTKYPIDTLKIWKNLIKDDGKIILGMNNRMGIRFFCGEEDPYTGTRFDSIENYLRLSETDKENMYGHCYDLYELEQLLQQAGINNYKKYSVFPCLEEPQLIYAENSLPSEDLSVRYFPKYRSDSGIFIEEEYLLESLIKNGLFHKMANAYIFECCQGMLSTVDHITLSVGRGKEESMATVLTSDDKAIKVSLYKEGHEKLERLAKNHNMLRDMGISVVESVLKNDCVAFPLIHGELGNNYLKRLLYSNDEKLLAKMDRFRDIIFSSSRTVFWDEKLGPILDKGYIDLVPLNCFHVNEEFIFFDQEFVTDNYPANAILYRAICIIYWGHINDPNIFPFEKMLERYGLKEKQEHWENLSCRFTEKLHVGQVQKNTCLVPRNSALVKENRQTIAYGNSTYRTLFEDIFGDISGKKIFIFGAGQWAKCFVDMYHNDIKIECIIDNNAELWEKEKFGIKVMSPSLLAHMDPDDYKIFICVKEFKYILEQLKILGSKNIAVFNRYKVYPGRHTAYIFSKDEDEKRFRVGYVAGVFDLFHIGHLNMFKRAKELCDYLIVGVVTDEQVKRNKHKKTFIPFEERIEIVGSCKYVDEAVEIPLDFSGTVEAFQKYHFDVQFSGSDYVNDTWWLEQRDYLENQGAELIFFPYTQSTSSTMLQNAIKREISEE